MITNEIYFSLLQREIERGSLPRLQAAMASVRADYVQGLVERGRIDASRVRHKAFGLLTSQGLVDVRGKDDITPLMLACALYRQKVVAGDQLGAKTFDGIANWLLQEQASVGAEGCRPLLRKIDRRTGQVVYERGPGRNVMSAIGWTHLPPSVRRHIKSRGAVEQAERGYEQAA